MTGVAEALDALASVVDGPAAEQLDVARTAWRARRRVVLLGRVGAGKTSLLRAMGAEDAGPVGLGGVTRAPRVVALGAVDVVDTPGIDALPAALAELGPLLATADAAVWVVDGLQPCTATERELLAATLPAGLPLAAVVTRLDLVDDTDAAAVLERVATLARPLGAAQVLRVNPRREPVSAALLDGPPSPRRRAEVAAALALVDAGLAARGEGLDVDALELELRALWRGLVRDARAAAEASRPALGRSRLETLGRLEREAAVRVVVWRDLLGRYPDAAAVAGRAAPPEWPVPVAPAPRGLAALALPPLPSARDACLAWLVDGEERLAGWLARARDEAALDAWRAQCARAAAAWAALSRR